jgi:hypothetical protein
MATIANILNLVQCGLNAVIGTGTKGCRPFLKKVSSIWLLPQGTKLDSTRTLDEEYAKELQAEGKLIVLKGIRTFSDNTPDDTTEELEDGTKQLTKYGKYEFMVNFINGLYFNAALHTLSGFNDYDVIFWDIEGNGLGSKASDGSLKGFTVGMLQATKLQWATDAAGAREGLMFQLLERMELDKDYVFVQGTSLDFNPQSLEGINEVVLSYKTVPANAATTITVVAKRKQDGKALTGASYTDFLLKKDGATANPTAGDDSATAGEYVLTVGTLSTNEALAISLYDTANSREVITLDTDLYKSNTATATVV